MPSKVKDTPPCDALNGHASKEEQKGSCEEVKDFKPLITEESTVEAKQIDKDSYIEENINEGNEKTSESAKNSSEADKETDSKKADESDILKDQEFVFIHDAGFIVQVIAPGAEPFDVQVIFIIYF